MSRLLQECARLTDGELLTRLDGLAARERKATAELIAHLAELETRNLHLAAGYSSMFAYCHEGLRLSEHEAYNRIEAARAARRFPAILHLLAQGAVNLTTVRLLAPHLTADNHAEALQSARGLRRSQVEEMVARLAPRPDVATTVRKLPAARVPASVAQPRATVPGATVVELPTDGPSPEEATGAHATRTPPRVSTPAEAPNSQLLPLSARPATIDALSPDRYKLQLTISGDTLEKLRRAKDLLRHAVPSGDEASILDRALTMLLAQLAKKKHAATDQPRRSRGVAAGARHLPAEVRRAVYARDGGCCAFIGVGGRRCGERAFIEFHHVQSFVDDGPPTIGNIELRCRRHNAHEWRQRCGDRSGADLEPPHAALREPRAG
jgi:hypothetical protein